MNREELDRKVKQIVLSSLEKMGYISSIDLLLELGVLNKASHDQWRNGKVPYLERVCSGSLSQLSFINSLMRTYAQQLKLTPSPTVYQSWGKGAKRPLRFSKTGERRVEEQYATHYIDRNRIAELKKSAKTT